MISELKHELAQFKKSIADFPWESKTAYADWLTQTHYFVSETTTFLTLAAAKSEKNSKMQLRFIEHAAEEKGHDKLLVMDLKGLGFSPTDFSQTHATAALYQPQYFWLHQRDSRAFFGYIVLLEGIAALYGPEINRRALAAHGKSATHFIRVHSSEDQEHIEKAFDEIETFPPEVAKMVFENFMTAARCYTWMLETIKERLTRSKTNAA